MRIRCPREADCVAVIGALTLAALSLFETPALALEPVSYPVGFRLIEEQDASRPVTGGTATASRPRPVRVYVWYPARSAASSMRFGRYAALADGDIWPPELAGTLRDSLRYSRGPLARSLDAAEFATLLQQRVAAAENARAMAGPFPLIVIGQGLYYESPIVFATVAEALAARGFVVATAPLVGTNSPFVRNDAQDLETQVRDLEFVIARARQLPFVSGESLGVLGFDQGGMAGVVLAMRNPDVDAFASLDSDILYPPPSGLPQRSPSYDPLALRVPWLHATPPRGVALPADAAAKSLMDTATYSNRYLLVTDGMGHVDFTGYALIANRRSMPGYWGEAAAESAVLHGIVREYVSGFFSAFLRRDAENLSLLSGDPKKDFPAANFALEHRPATPPSIGYDELVQAIATRGGERAIAELRAAVGSGTSPMLLDEDHLLRLAFSLIYNWGLETEALPLLEYTAERYPQSAQAQGMLAEGYVAVERYAPAIEVLTRYVQQHPNEAAAAARLEQVRVLAGERRP